MNESIRKVEGIGHEFQKKLAYIGIQDVSEYLVKAQSQEDRDELAKDSEIPVGYINNWASMLDLTRIEGVGYQYAELLTYVGVRSVEDFRKRNSTRLYHSMRALNDKNKLTGSIPSVECIDQFIMNAKKITNIVERY